VTSSRPTELPRSASQIEEMEKRSRRRIRDLVTQAAFQGLSENESGCARISIMARSTNAPFTGRIQKRKTNPLHRLHSACNTRPVHTEAVRGRSTAGPSHSRTFARGVPRATTAFEGSNSRLTKLLVGPRFVSCRAGRPTHWRFRCPSQKNTFGTRHQSERTSEGQFGLAT
jgi:hypothetical protein